MTPTEQFIADHAEADVRKLALQASKYPAIDMPFALQQIAGRQKIRKKIPSFYQNPLIHYPAQLSLEQSSSEITANYKRTLCEGHTLADLTGGFGIDSSFISRNFKQAFFVERQEELCQIAKHNFELLGLSHIAVIQGNAEEVLTTLPDLDLIFIDPARRGAGGQKLYRLSDCEPNVGLLAPQLLAKAPKVLIKLSPMLDISQLQAELHPISELHILSIDNDCKELLILLDLDYQGDTKIITQNFIKDEQQTFSFTADDEFLAQSAFTDTVDNYLYEPNASVLKAGAFKLTGSSFGLKKLHPHTHLYTSAQLITNFPGRIFEVINYFTNSKQEIKNLKKQFSKANISTRNYAETTEQLRKKTNLQDGGDIYIFACKMNDEKFYLIVTKKINKEIYYQ